MADKEERTPEEKFALEELPTLPGPVGDSVDQLSQHVDQFPPVNKNANVAVPALIAIHL